MSFPNIPENIDPAISLPQDQVISLILASIAFQELGLANFVNSEAEIIQSVLGTLNGQTSKNPSTGELERVDKLVEKILREVARQEILLQYQLDDIIDFEPG